MLILSTSRYLSDTCGFVSKSVLGARKNSMTPIISIVFLLFAASCSALVERNVRIEGQQFIETRVYKF